MKLPQHYPPLPNGFTYRFGVQSVRPNESEDGREVANINSKILGDRISQGEIQFSGDPNIIFGARRRSHEPEYQTTKAGFGVPIGQFPRVCIYSAKIELDDFGTKMNLQLLKDHKKMYFVIWDKFRRVCKEMDIFMK